MSLSYESSFVWEGFKLFLTRSGYFSAFSPVSFSIFRSLSFSSFIIYKYRRVSPGFDLNSAVNQVNQALWGFSTTKCSSHLTGCMVVMFTSLSSSREFLFYIIQIVSGTRGRRSQVSLDLFSELHIHHKEPSEELQPQPKRNGRLFTYNVCSLRSTLWFSRP